MSDTSEMPVASQENGEPTTLPEQKTTNENEGQSLSVGDILAEDAGDVASDEPMITNVTVGDPASVQLAMQPVVNGLTRPVYVTHAGDGSGRLFVVEQPGLIRIVQDGALLPDPFLDIRDRVNDGGNEQGLLGLAFAPNFTESGTFFVNYTGQDGSTSVSRFVVSASDSNRADVGSEFLVLNIAQPARNHNGGMILFGPDDYLYIGTGDGGAANDRFGHGQNPNTLLGKMLRLDVTSNPNQPYLIPSDNPWVATDWAAPDGTMVDVRDEIWSIGLRNPWRYSFDRHNGNLWIGDVGQNAYEEINVVMADRLTPNAIQPLNFGWPIMEGFHCFETPSGCDSSSLLMPVSEYAHRGHCSVTGGYVYRGQTFPTLNGIYLYGDFCSGVVWGTVPAADGSWRTVEMLRSGLTLSSFGEDEAGELYATDLSGGVYRVTVSG